MPFWNVSLFVYDKWIGRMNYDKETLRKAYPLMTAHRLVPVAG
jgi:hypothetical protein